MNNPAYQHDKYFKSKGLIRALAKSSLNQLLIFLMGVSRTGKTTLAEELCEEFNNDKEGSAVMFRCPAKMTATYTYNPFLHAFLEALGDPFARTLKNHGARRTQDQLLYLVTERIKQQGVRIVVIDEAGFFVLGRNTNQNRENLQFLKHLVNETKVPIVLTGTGELVDILNQDGQIINRSHVIFFEPYDCSNAEEAKIFIQVIREFQASLRIKFAQSVEEGLSIFAELTNGCVGALNELLRRAMAFAEEFGADEVNVELLRLANPKPEDEVRVEEIRQLKEYIGRYKKPNRERGKTNSSKIKSFERKATTDPVGAEL